MAHMDAYPQRNSPRIGAGEIENDIAEKTGSQVVAGFTEMLMREMVCWGTRGLRDTWKCTIGWSGIYRYVPNGG